MIAGRKLLLADDSAAIQKVIALTFADEGMQVFTVDNGRSALETLEQVAPDVVLADVFMPDVSGYDLCRWIKQSERFAQIPVMLLVSSFEPFDEAEARSAGADDIVAKPFQSIRQLVSRVGSLLGGAPAADDTPRPYSTLGLSTAAPGQSRDSQEPEQSAASDESNVTVLVEAAPLESLEEPDASDEDNVHVLMEAAELETQEEPAEGQGPTCLPDIDLQTADTQKLGPVAGAETETPGHEWQFQDTVEIEPAVTVAEDKTAGAVVSEEGAAAGPTFENMNQTVEQIATSNAIPVVNESLLELEDQYVSADALSDDVILELDFEEPVIEEPEGAAYVPEVEPAFALQTPAASGAAAEAFVTSEPKAVAAELLAPVAVPATPTAELRDTIAQRPMSSEAIDAIARRVVEQMSEKVVREIAWEVVPELSELLIKKKIDEGQ